MNQLPVPPSTAIFPPRWVVLTGAGISAESGLPTYRGAGGLWRQHAFQDLASIEGWERNADLVQEFYNERRQLLGQVQPNAAHRFLAELERSQGIRIITQNVDDLHERAGSRDLLHLHGKLTEVCREHDRAWVQDIGYRALALDERCPAGHRLRPNVVWFGEEVPAMEEACAWVEAAEGFLIIGTSLQVYPAASLLDCVRPGVPIWLIDPEPLPAVAAGVRHLRTIATQGLPLWFAEVSQAARGSAAGD